MSERWLKLSVLVSIFLIGLPTAAGFYPPLFAGLASYLPLDFILTWMGRVGLVLLGFLLGWIFRAKNERDQVSEDNIPISEQEANESDSKSGDNDSWDINEIEGCIETDGVLWKGVAEISNGKVIETELIYKAICPRCQTVMYDGTKDRGIAVATSQITYWECPNSNCSHRTVDDYSKYESAENLFDTEVRKLVESENQDYSLDSIKSNIQPADNIWEEYSKIVDAPHVSTDCFY